jgi:dCMP deaminase
MVYSAAEEAAHKEERYHRLYMDIAYRVSEMSHAKRRKVGCVIVKDERIISMGWNGMPTGMTNNCEIDESDQMYVGTTKREVLHAEANALMKLAKYGSSSNGATLYTTTSPCFECAKLIYQSGIKKLVYSEFYTDQQPLTFLYTTPGFNIIHLEK